MNLKIWQLNLLISVLEKELAEKIHIEMGKMRNDSDVPLTAEQVERIKSLHDNPHHNIGQINLTIKDLMFKRDNYSVACEKVLGHCTHENIKKSVASSAVCECGTNFGWFCPESPDKTCHYNTEKASDGFYVTLASGFRHKMPAFYTEENHNNENEDECIFCGEPDERK